ncbi:glycerophosphodiester phosphodiesterase [Streptomyces sp. NPDC050147]|uniref:glycerophosphodiester phosphodiesterase n=1 Tax=Streptomyces sp. NPDC050147 TaxID=3155513 RepID=UPI00343B5051
MRTVTAVAHRGDPYRVRENTLPSLRSAFQRGADAVEIDVRLSRDGVPVLLHDASLKRLWELDRPLSVLSADEVRGLTEDGVPTLEEAVAATEGHRLMVDLPDATPESVRAVVGVIADCGAAERVYYCAGARTMLAVRAVDPAAEIALTWTSLAPPRAAVLDAIKPRWLNYRFSLLNRELVTQVRRQGLLVSAWTPDTKRSMRRLLDIGVDAITTNRIDTLHALRERSDGALS